MRTLTDGEREVLAELQDWGADEGAEEWSSGNWCPVCDEAEEACRCPRHSFTSGCPYPGTYMRESPKGRSALVAA